jgi:hypothetical protein
MLAVLALRLPVEARAARWSVQDEDAVVARQGLDLGRLVRLRAVHAKDERSPVTGEVVGQGGDDCGRVVRWHGGRGGAVRDAPVGRDEHEAQLLEHREVHRVEAAQDAGT